MWNNSFESSLIKNTLKTVILWNITYIWKNVSIWIYLKIVFIPVTAELTIP